MGLMGRMGLMGFMGRDGSVLKIKILSDNFFMR